MSIDTGVVPPLAVDGGGIAPESNAAPTAELAVVWRACGAGRPLAFFSGTAYRLQHILCDGLRTSYAVIALPEQIIFLPYQFAPI